MTLEMQSYSVVAKIAIGERVSDNGRPTKLDHFIATHPNPNSKGAKAPRHAQLTKYFEEKYKTNKPKVLDVVLVDHHPDEVFYSNYMNYRGTKCSCKGDGKKAIRIAENGDKVEVDCNYEECKFRWNRTDKGVVNTCKPTGILTFIIPDAPIAGGVIRFTTHSVITIQKLNASLRELHCYRGTLKFLKVRLTVVPTRVTPNGKDQTVFVVQASVPVAPNEIANGAGTHFLPIADIRQEIPTLRCAPDKNKLALLESTFESEEDDVITGEVIDSPNNENVQTVEEPQVPPIVNKANECEEDDVNF